MNEFIEINVETTYLSSESNPDENKYYFLYTVLIKNNSQKKTKLFLVICFSGDGGFFFFGVRADEVEWIMGFNPKERSYKRKFSCLRGGGY